MEHDDKEQTFIFIIKEIMLKNYKNVLTSNVRSDRMILIIRVRDNPGAYRRILWQTSSSIL